MNNKKLLLLGFIGSVLSLICDLLLGWMVYPEASDFYIAMIIPNTAFANGLGMSNMALGGMLPFLGI